jgi:diacylglycerol O-acyltransferase
MTRLHALDALWLELEHGGPPLAMGLVTVLDGPAPPVSQVRAMVAERIHAAPSLSRVAVTETGMRRPEWREGVSPDLSHHVTSRRIGAGDAAVERFVSGLMEQPMALDRPLWDLTVLRGHAKQQWALVWRLHHAVADGLGARAAIGPFFDLDAEGKTPLSAAMAAIAATAGGRSSGKALPGAVRDAVDGIAGRLADVARHLPTAARVVSDVTPKPPGSLTGEISTRRRWVHGTTDLSSVRAAAHRSGCTVNDVVLAGVAIGFRRLLESRGEPTSDRTVRCAMPVSLRSAADDDTNNQISLAWVDLPLGDVSARERVRTIAAETSLQKHTRTPLLGAALLSLTDHLVPATVQDVVVAHGDWIPEWFAETVVTNVPGAPFPLYFMGRRVAHSHPVIPVDGHLRITVGVYSHEDTLGFGISGDGVHAADVDVLMAGIIEGLRELSESLVDAVSG